MVKSLFYLKVDKFESFNSLAHFLLERNPEFQVGEIFTAETQSLYYSYRLDENQVFFCPTKKVDS